MSRLKYQYSNDEDRERLKWYQDYLLSPEWKAKRAAVLARCNGICEACGKVPAIQVHHTTYEHIFREPLWELRGVCGPCHDGLTEMDRKRRNHARR